MADRKARLQRGGRRIVRFDKELCGLVAERIGLFSRGFVVAEGHHFDVEQIVRARLARPKLHEPVDLGAGDERALRTNRFRRIDRQVEHVAASEQPLRAVHVENHARIGLRAHRKGDP